MTVEQRPALPGSKWGKHVTMIRSETLRPYLPETAVYSEWALHEYLSRFPVVFIKPAVGSGGRQVFCVRRGDRGHFHVQLERDQGVTNSLTRIHRLVEREAKGRLFLIQQGIDLVYWNGRPVDIRTIAQRNEENRFEVTGTFCKVAGRNLAVTNVAIGGEAHPVDRYFKAIGQGPLQRVLHNLFLEALTLAVVKPFGDMYRNATYGLDIGLDAEGRFYLIELNTLPRIDILKEMRLVNMYDRARELWVLNKSSKRRKELRRMPIEREDREDQVTHAVERDDPDDRRPLR